MVCSSLRAMDATSNSGCNGVFALILRCKQLVADEFAQRLHSSRWSGQSSADAAVAAAAVVATVAAASCGCLMDIVCLCGFVFLMWLGTVN